MVETLHVASRPDDWDAATDHPASLVKTSPATISTQADANRIRFDFHPDAGVVLPTEGQWRIRPRDLDSGNVLFRSDNSDGCRVIRIDRKPVHGAGLVWTHVPPGIEDHAADRSRSGNMSKPVVEKVSSSNAC